MNLTKNFRFRKPEGTDPVNIEDFNDNFDLIDEELKKRPTGTDDLSATIVTFQKASERANIAPKETLSVLFGKIMKTFSDLKNVAFSGSYEDLEGKPALQSGASATVIESADDLAAVTKEGYVVGGKAGAQLINKLTAKTYGNRTKSLALTLNDILNYSNIPYAQSRDFAVQASDGYYICHATAWNTDWIGGIATPGTSSQNETFSFIRKVGADTVLKKCSSLVSAVFTKLIESNMINGIGANGTYTFAQDCPLAVCLWIGYHQSNYDEDNAQYTLTGSHGEASVLISRRDHYQASWTMEIKVMTIRDIKTGAKLTMSFSGTHHMSYVCAYSVSS